MMDIETTGLDLIKSRPIQFAFEIYQKKSHVIGSGYNLIAERMFYIKQSKPLPTKTIELTGITDEILDRKGLSNTQATDYYHSLIWTHQPAIIVGYNFINFDFPIIQNWLFQFRLGNFKHPPSCAILDVMHLYSMYARTTKWIKLSQAAKELSITPEGKLHNAQTDVSLTWQIYTAIGEIV